MSDDSFWSDRGRRRASSDRFYQTRDLERQRQRHHDETVAALGKKSEREASLDTRERQLEKQFADLADYRRGQDDAYTKRYMALEAEFADRVDQAADPLRERVSAWGNQLKAIFEARHAALNRRSEGLRVTHDIISEQINYYHRLRGLPEVDTAEERRQRRARIDKWFGENAPDHRQLDEVLSAERPDPKAEHLDDVAKDVAAAVEIHSEPAEAGHD